MGTLGGKGLNNKLVPPYTNIYHQVWGAGAQAVEPPQFQGPRVPPRDVAGRRQLQQKEVPVHKTGRCHRIPLLDPQRHASRPQNPGKKIHDCFSVLQGFHDHHIEKGSGWVPRS